MVGGIDTDGLCGFPEAKNNGWDLEVIMTSHHLEYSTCKQCAKKYKEIKESK